MVSIAEILLIVINLYIWVLMAQVVMSWLVAFNVVNTRNRLVYTVADFLYRITEPALRQRDLTRYQKSNVIARAQIENSPTSIAAWLTRRLTMGNSPFGNWSEPEAIGKVTLEDIDQWRREVFARDNATIIDRKSTRLNSSHT